MLVMKSTGACGGKGRECLVMGLILVLGGGAFLSCS